TSTWFSTTTGPEATKTLSLGTLDGWAAASACTGAAATTAVCLEPLQPLKPSTRISTPITMQRFMASLASPAKPPPDLPPEPHARPPEEDLAGGFPCGEDLAAALHSRADQAVVVVYADPRKEDVFLALQLALRTHNCDLAAKRARRKSLELNRRLPARSELSDILLIDGNIHNCPRGIDDFCKSIARLQ